jgi:hypothetical protein
MVAMQNVLYIQIDLILAKSVEFQPKLIDGFLSFQELLLQLFAVDKLWLWKHQKDQGEACIGHRIVSV